jgi:hypothetical protein
MVMRTRNFTIIRHRCKANGRSQYYGFVVDEWWKHKTYERLDVQSVLPSPGRAKEKTM